jgi:large subunit ribosomal protein L25
MKQFSLKVESRGAVGRRPSRAQRAEGKVPAIIYGKGQPRGLMIDAKSFSKLYKQVSGITALVELEDDKGQKSLSLIQEVQRNKINDNFNHVDFLEVKANEQMKANVRIRTVGESVGVKMEGALLEVVYPQVTIRCLPKDLPEYLEINVEGLHAGDAVFMRDLKAISGVKFIDKPDQVVITCNVPEVEEEAAPAAATPAEGAVPVEGAAPADGTAPAADAKAADGTKAAAVPGAKAPAAAAAGKDAKSAKAPAAATKAPAAKPEAKKK